MIRKILKIRNVGRFTDFKPSGDVTFGRYTLIYADNGTGKSTLCDVIRSLQTGDPDLIVGRRTLGRTDPQEVDILLDGGERALFRNGAWSQTLGGVTIFDAGYVSRNVHAGEIVDPDHRKNLFRVIVGEEGVRLSERVENIAAEIAALAAPIRESTKGLEARLQSTMTLKEFLALTADEEIEAKITSAERAVEGARDADALRSHRGFSEIDAPVLPSGLPEVLGRTLEGVSLDAERRLHAQTSRIGGDHAQAWLSQGLDHLADDCPFCGQDIRGNELVAAYQVCFSEAYRDLSGAVARLSEEVEIALGDAARSRLISTLERNAEAATFWSRYLGEGATLRELDHGNAVVAMADAQATVAAALHAKAGNLLDPAELDAAHTNEILTPLCHSIEAYNAAVSKANARAEAQRDALRFADAAEAKRRLAALKLHRDRFQSPLAEQCDEHAKLLAEKSTLEKRKKEAREALEEYTQRVMGRYEQALNQHLERFLVGFRIEKTEIKHPRGIPSSSYTIVINNIPVDLGDEKTPISEPSFRNTLSGGDRSALALSLFMSELDRDPAPPGVAVILDDPFQSQDRFRQNATAYQIRRCGERCGQVIVMSHDARFLKQVHDLLEPSDRKTLRLSVAGPATILTEWDIEDHLKSAHDANIDAVKAFLDRGEGDPRDIVKILRLIAEAQCRRLCHGEFPERVMLGQMIAQVRSAGDQHPLNGLVDELDELNGWTSKHHHPTPAADDLHEGELRAYAQRTLKLIRLPIVSA
ncbi:MAG: AAA family ATPase [Shimia sp.]